MFVQTLEEMKSLILIESGLYQTLTASNVGINPEIISEGDCEYTYHEARNIVAAFDKALISCPKYLQKRIRAQRMSFVFAFGPGMEEVCGLPPAIR
jgi:hypothetical protein